MITITRVKQATAQFIKVLRFGNADVVTGQQYLPHGLDSKPVNEAVAAYSLTADKAEAAVLGYLMQSEITEAGETRLFSTDANGTTVFSILLKNDGTAEVGGNVDNMVRYSPLNTGLQSYNTSVQAELVKIAAAINAIVPGSYIPGTLSIDISGAKINDIKTQ